MHIEAPQIVKYALRHPGQFVTLLTTIAVIGLTGCRGNGESSAEQVATPMASTLTPQDGALEGVNGATGCGVHVVAAGNTLFSIARQYGTDLESILAVNNIPNPNVIMIGQQIHIPCTTGPGVESTATIQPTNTLEWIPPTATATPVATAESLPVSASSAGDTTGTGETAPIGGMPIDMAGEEVSGADQAETNNSVDSNVSFLRTVANGLRIFAGAGIAAGIAGFAYFLRKRDGSLEDENIRAVQRYKANRKQEMKGLSEKIAEIKPTFNQTEKLYLELIQERRIWGIDPQTSKYVRDINSEFIDGYQRLRDQYEDLNKKLEYLGNMFGEKVVDRPD